MFLSTYIFPKAVFDIFRYFPDKWLLVKCFFDSKPPFLLIHIDMVVGSVLV
jgi:hypothetical protein